MDRIENIDFCIRYLLEQNHTRRHVYKMLFMRFPEAFVVTTNVDGQFELAGFPTERIFATQGDYRWFQPASGTPKTLIESFPPCPTVARLR